MSCGTINLYKGDPGIKDSSAGIHQMKCRVWSGNIWVLVCNKQLREECN